MIKIQRIYKFTLDDVYLLMLASKNSGENLFELLSNCRNCPNDWAVLRATRDNDTIGVALCYAKRPDMILWLLSGVGFISWHNEEVEQQFFRWVKSMGCNYVKCYGRVGWIKKLKLLSGWKSTKLEFGKEVK